MTEKEDGKRDLINKTEYIKQWFYKYLISSCPDIATWEEEAPLENKRKVDIKLTTTEGETIFIEQKISESDLNSGYGINFEGDYNFFLIPKELLFPTLKTIKNLGLWGKVGVILYAPRRATQLKDMFTCFLCSTNKEKGFSYFVGEDW